MLAVMKLNEWKLASVLGLASLCLVCWTVSRAADDAGQAAVSLGKIAPFSLQDAQGMTHTRKSWQAAPAVVLLFLGTECPVANGYAPEMARLAKQFADRGVVFIGVHCDPDVTAKLAAQHAREYQLTFPILLDPEQKLAKPAGVRMMSAAVVLLPDGEVVYRGRIDDRYTDQGKRRLEPTTHDLKTAIEAVLSGKKPEPAETKTYGCPFHAVPPQRGSNKPAQGNALGQDSQKNLKP